MNVRLPVNLESRLYSAFSRLQSLADAQGLRAAFTVELTAAGESMRKALRWQSRTQAEHALRDMLRLAVEMEETTLPPARSAAESDAKG